MISRVDSEQEGEEFYKVLSETTFSWSELALPPSDFQFGPTRDSPFKPALMMVPHKKEETLTNNSSSIFDEIDVSAFIIQVAVKSAVYLKTTTIPERISDTVETVVEFGSVMEQHYAIKAKVKEIGHAFVSAIINVITTFIAATLQFIIAYHNAPGRLEGSDKLYLQGRIRPENLDESQLVTFSIGGQVFTTKLDHVISRKGSLLGRLVRSRRSLEEAVFVDRDGTHFRHVLNHLRGASSVSHIRDPQVLDDLLVEAEYYELPDLTESLLMRKSEI